MKDKKFILIIVFLLIVLILANACFKNKTNEKEKKVSLLFREQNEQIDIEQIKKIIKYGFVKAILYKDCYSFPENIEKISGEYKFSVYIIKDEMEDFDDLIFIVFKDFKRLNFMIRTKGKKYYYASCVSDDDIRISLTNAQSILKLEHLKIKLNNIKKGTILEFINKEHNKKIIDNIKRQISILFDEEDFKREQNFYIGSTSNFDLSIKLYWVEKKYCIDLSRIPFDMELKNIEMLQFHIIDFINKDKVDSIIKYGTLITIEKEME